MTIILIATASICLIAGFLTGAHFASDKPVKQVRDDMNEAEALRAKLRHVSAEASRLRHGLVRKLLR